jgi:hypothetical protein
MSLTKKEFITKYEPEYYIKSKKDLQELMFSDQVGDWQALIDRVGCVDMFHELIRCSRKGDRNDLRMCPTELRAHYECSTPTRRKKAQEATQQS